MTPRLIVHIGTHKTGSACLQRALHEAREQLLAAGVYFPNDPRSLRRGRHQSLAQAARSSDSAQADAEFAKLLQGFEASGAHTLLLSAETLSLPQAGVEFFQRFVRAGFTVEVVCYLRRQDVWVESLYNQALRAVDEPETRDISAFWHDERTLARMDYHSMLRTWQALPARVQALDFASEVAQHGLTGSFLRAIGQPELGPLPEKSRNPSADMNLLLTLRQMALQKIDHTAKRLVRAAKLLEEQADHTPLHHVLGAVERQALLATVADSNAALTADFGVSFDATLPTEGQEPVTQPSAAYVLALIAAISEKRDSDDEDEDNSDEERAERARVQALLAEQREKRAKRRDSQEQIEAERAQRQQARQQERQAQREVERAARAERAEQGLPKPVREDRLTPEERAKRQQERQAQREAAQRPGVKPEREAKPGAAGHGGREGKAGREGKPEREGPALTPEERQARRQAREAREAAAAAKK